MLGTADITNGELDFMTDKQVKSYNKYLTKQLKTNTMKKEQQMTEKQFIAKFKKAGFELYKTAGIKLRVEAVDLLRRLNNNLQEKETYEEATTTKVLINEVDAFLKNNEPDLPLPINRK